jgi:uncharacterized protein YfaS (alpha-2-macroglobulin family)
MIKRWIVVVILSGLALAGIEQTWAQAAPAAVPVALNEAKAIAILEHESIKLQLSLSAPAPTGVRMVAWLLSPQGAPSAEVAVDMQPSARSASLALPWPKDQHGSPVSDLGWYRIAYRLELRGKPITHGILAVGAICPNLLALRVARPAVIASGKPVSFRVYTGNPVTREPFKGVALQATLALDDKETAKVLKTVVRQATTGSSGEARIIFPAMSEAGQSVTLTVIGTMTGSRAIDSGLRGLVSPHAQATVKVDFEISDKTIIRVESDKPLHKPGETVHLRVLVFNDNRQAAAATALTLALSDPDRKTLLEVPLTTNRFGIASYDWKTGPQLAPGDYETRFALADSSAGENSSSKTIRIRRYELPEFATKVAMDRGFYLEGQAPVAHVHAGYLFGKPVSAGSVRVTRADEREWNSKTNRYDEPKHVEQDATLDANGDAQLTLDVKKDFEDFKDSERYKDLQFRATVTDATTGRSEPRNFTVRLSHFPVHLYVRAMGGNDREGDYLVSTGYADGRPASCKVTLDWTEQESRPIRAATLTTNRFGLARIHLRFHDKPMPTNRYGYGGFALRMTALDREGRTSRFDDTLHPEDPDSIWISVAHSLLKPGDAVEAILHGPQGATIDVDAHSEDGPITHQQVHMNHSEEGFTVPAGPKLHGLVSLEAYAMSGDHTGYLYIGNGSIGMKSVLYPEDRQLRFKLTGLRTTYLPGAAVDATLSVHEPSGVPATGAIGVAVIDTAVEQRAATEEEANDYWFGWNWWQNDGDLADLALADLNRVDMSKPVDDDLDLFAEAKLQSENGLGISLEESSENDAPDQYISIMAASLRPVGEAVLAARPARLPATLEDVRSITQAAKIDDSELLDPWGTPYKVEVSIVGDDEVVCMVSAGPDKRIGTRDDLSFELMRRDFFALAGERLTKLVVEAVKAGRALPATSNGLKALALSGGLNLDTTFDPHGKPYLYEVDVRRRFYTFHVFPHDAVLQPDGHYAGDESWTGPAIDYFLPTEARLEAAIRSRVDEGHPFPETEAEARQAFTAAGIDFDALRDPLGNPFQLHTTELLAYSQVEKVTTTPAAVQVKDKPITHRMRAVQILRPSEQNNDSVWQYVVAQFLHPIEEQSAIDLKPHAVSGGIFKGFNGEIGGTVTDQTGAVIVGAWVTVRNRGGETVAHAATGDDGIYQVADLVPGVYSVQVSARSFTPTELEEVTVYSASLTTVDVALTVGAESQTVSVLSGADVANLTDSAEVSSVISTGTSRIGKAPEPTFTPRLRHVFEETAYWAPSLEIDAKGRTSLHFNLPDSLTTWKLHALASTVDGRIVPLDQTFKSFQPFFVDLDAPQVLTVGDEITLPVNLRNYTQHSIALPVAVKPAGWFSLFTPPALQATVPSNGTTPVFFGLHASNAVETGTLNINAANAHDGDAVEKTVRVHPDGEPQAVTASGLLHGGATTLFLNLPIDAIPGSVHAALRTYPNLGAHVSHAMKAVLERPYGCGEQTLSSTYPSLLFLELLKASKSSSPAETEAQTYLQLGYDRLLNYVGAGGGITYWGRSDESPDPALTAYGIEFLTEAEPYIAVDRSRIVDAVTWLVSNQQADGTWKPHYGDSKADLNLYVASVLARTVAADDFAENETKGLRDRANKAVAKAVAWSAMSVAAVHDPYANALRLQLATDVAAKASLRAELLQTAERDGHGAHWSSPGYSPFYGWGHAGDLETTALVFDALAQKKTTANEQAINNEAMLYILDSQDRYGIWYSGQATVRVLKALLPMAIEQIKTPATSSEFRLSVNGVPLAGNDAEALHADPKLLEAPRSVDLTRFLKAGSNQLVFTNAAANSLASASASVNYYVPWHEAATPAQAKTQTGKDAGLDFGYQCAAGNVKVGQSIECKVDVRRFGSIGYGMVLAEVGLPPGADVDRLSLAKLLDNWTISRYELQPDRIVFYLWTSKAEGEHFSFRFTPRYAVRAKAAPATLSDYYNPDLRVVLAPQLSTVK